MEVSVAGALEYIHNFMHPQVYITDDSSREEAFLMKKVQEKALRTGKSVIELPPNAIQKLMWMTRLDSGSLSSMLLYLVSFQAWLTNLRMAYDIY